MSLKAAAWSIIVTLIAPPGGTVRTNPVDVNIPVKSVSLFFIITFKVLIRLRMYNTSLPHVWSPALSPHPNPSITHFNYRIIPVGYCIIIVSNIINIQLIDTCITCFAF